jgi:Protein of unknown function (DUF3159)
VARGAGTSARELDGELPEPTWRLLLGRGLPQFVAETILPVVAFYVAWRESGLVAGIVVSSVVSLAIAGWLVRAGRDTGPVLIGVAFVAIQAGVALAAHSTTVYLAQPVVFSVLLALGYAGSVLVGKPAIGIFASAWYPFPDWFRNSAPFKREFGMQTLVWAVFMLLRAALRLWVLLNAGVGGFIVVSLLTGVPPYVALVGWGIWHARRSFTRLDVPDADS